MKLLGKLVGAVAAIGVLCVGGLVYSANSSSEVASMIDQVNPLIKTGAVYVKTQAADEVDSYGIASYTQKAADSQGKIREIRFTADHELKIAHYLKLVNKGSYIQTYEEVSRTEVPEKALQQIG